MGCTYILVKFLRIILLCFGGLQASLMKDFKAPPPLPPEIWFESYSIYFNYYSKNVNPGSFFVLVDKAFSRSLDFDYKGWRKKFFKKFQKYWAFLDSKKPGWSCCWSRVSQDSASQVLQHGNCNQRYHWGPCSSCCNCENCIQGKKNTYCTSSKNGHWTHRIVQKQLHADFKYGIIDIEDSKESDID